MFVTEVTARGGERQGSHNCSPSRFTCACLLPPGAQLVKAQVSTQIWRMEDRCRPQTLDNGTHVHFPAV